MLNINYFASIRESLGCSNESLELPAATTDVAGLISHLAARAPQWSLLKDESVVLVAVNQNIVGRAHPLQGDEEVAFFPPMTGG